MSQKASFRKSLLGAAILGLASLFLAVGDARASSLIITVSDSFGTSYDIVDQFPPDTNNILNQIQADTSGLTFANFTLVSLSASSNNPGEADPNGAFVQAQATVQNLTGVADTLTVTAYQTNFSLPTGPSVILTNTSTANYVNAPAGSTQTAEAWYNPTSPNVPPPPFGTPAPLISIPMAGTNSTGMTTMLGGLPSTADFSLTTQFTITLGTTVGAQDTGSSIAALHAIPEPASVIMLGTAAPLALVLLSKIRRGRKQAAA